MNEQPVFPVFLAIGGKSCFIVGGGKIALRKAHDLLEAGADVTVVAENPSQEIRVLSDRGLITLRTKRFEESDIGGAYLVFAATDDSAVNAGVALAAHKNHALINTVDTPELCEFFSGAVVRRGRLRIAVSTSGRCPGLAGQLRKEIEGMYPDDIAAFIDAAGEMRSYILDRKLDTGVKNSALSWLTQPETRTFFFNYGKERTWQELKKLISS